jgi:hypothetical protein
MRFRVDLKGNGHIVMTFRLMLLGLFCLLAILSSQYSYALVKEFQGVRKARIDFKGGMPRLMINEKPVVPITFFFNVNQVEDALQRFQDPQVKLAMDAGIHIYSMLVGSANYGGAVPDYSEFDKTLDSFIKVDPQAIFILRTYPGPHPGWKEWASIPKEERMLFTDGSMTSISLASDYFWGFSNKGMADLIHHFEDGRFANRILAYNIGGPQFEMFQDEFFIKGPDICEANQRRFRKWLRTKYQTDEALQKAWGAAGITLESARIPQDPGRFPVHGAGSSAVIKMFYDMPGEQNWVDYSDYYNNLVADRIIDWAELIKRETGGKKLNVFCYGYLFELMSSFHGHYALHRVLENPAVDIIMSPISYLDRLPGGCGGFMSPVDTVTAHGKLWLNEDDTRTSLIDTKYLPSWLPPSEFGYQSKDLHESINILERNLAKLLCHRAATWWCDLVGVGAFNSPALWDMLKERKPLYEDVYRHPKPYRPDVAVIVDERSEMFIKSDIDARNWIKNDLRNQCERSGASIGYYLLEDFIDSKVPRCKLYLFADTFYLTDEQIPAINARLDKEKATAIWVYAPGYIGTNGHDVAGSSNVTGIQLALKEGKLGSEGVGRLQNLKWTPDLSTSPRLVVTDENAVVMARYSSDGLNSMAVKQVGRHKSIFVGDVGLPYTVLSELFEMAGAHIWTRDASIVQTDGSILAVHSGTGGLKPIYLPKGIRAEAIKGTIGTQKDNTILVDFLPGDTLWFKLSKIR